MVTLAESKEPIKVPKLPSGSVKDFIPYLTKNAGQPISKLLEPYKTFEGELRKIYAQQPEHELVQDGKINLVPIFAGHEKEVTVHARSLATESEEEKSKYIMPLRDEERKPHGSPAVVTSLKDFQTNFNLFSESSLSDLDWSNVVAAGSAVTTSLLPVPDEWNESKRKLREYYHQHLAPASDVDLFLYGLNEAEALKKIVQIERNIKDSILSEVTTIRTKNAITIASQYPTRHVQIVLRLYDSISQILTGFDVDSACVAYDGQQVYAAPRAVTAFMTQANTIDLTRRSPSYENRLSKYSHRGFEVHWPLLERSRIDPTIFERSFGRTQGLARLLILEKLPNSSDRDAYMDQRRAERGRPAISRGYRNQYRNSGNIKDNNEDEVAEWVDQEEVASYHTMTVPYGQAYVASKINRLLYAKDLLLNAEWNQEDQDREVYLHRHPCFFGTAEEVLTDCCGFCPVPKTDEEIKVAEEESKTMVSGPLKFIMDDPGRQEIGSFNPITDDEWTTMAYVGDTARLCQAIVDNDLDHVEDWCSQEGVDVNRRDYTGRTPLHLATMVSTPEVVKCLIDHGARMIARLQDGRTALHIAAARGSVEMVKLLMDRSLKNEEEEEEKEEARKEQRKAERAAAKTGDGKDKPEDAEDEEEGNEGEDDDDSDEASEITLDSEDDEDSMTMGSFVKVDNKDQEKQEAMLEDSEDDPDVFDIDVIAWDFNLSPLHLAILNGHQEIIDLLVSEYGADVLLPVKFVESGSSTPKAAIMSILLTLGLPTEKAKAVVKQLLNLGATSAQGDMNAVTVFHYAVSENSSTILDVLLENDRPVALSVLNHLAKQGRNYYNQVYPSPLYTAIEKGHKNMVSKLLELGAKTTVQYDDWVKLYLAENSYASSQDSKYVRERYEDNVVQPVVLAAGKGFGPIVDELVKRGADPKTLEKTAYSILRNHDSIRYNMPQSLLEVIEQKLTQLKEWKEEEVKPPPTLKDEEFYLAGFEKGTYQHATALHNFQKEKKSNDEEWKQHKERGQKGPAEGTKEKREAVAKVIAELESTRKTLIKAGAKPFAELHPEVPKYDGSSRYHNHRYTNPPDPPYETKIHFKTPDLTDVKKEGYIQLFEAAWSGDLEKIKALTLAQWKASAELKEPALQTPLKVAIQDDNGFSPFSIAVLRGHYELAQKIIEICLTQYHKDDGISSRKRWAMKVDSSDDEYSDDDSYDGRNAHEHLPIFSELVSDKFTIDGLGEVATLVKSNVLPLQMINWSCRAQKFFTQLEDTDNIYSSLLMYALEVENKEIFDFILKIGAEQQALLAEDEDDTTAFHVDTSTFRWAISLGRVAMLGDLIKASGVGIPLNELVKDSGVEIKTKPKYYQGLSVGGKKRADWAQAPDHVQHVAEESLPPLLTAAKQGNIDSVEWFTSSAPLRKYKEFAEANKHDKRIKTLEAGKGFDKTIENWLSSYSEFVLHAAIVAPHDDEDEKSSAKYFALLKHILSNTPDLLEKKSSEGLTPLHVAVITGQADTVKFLIAEGANQRTRDKNGKNLMHSIVVPQIYEQKDAKKARELIELLDKQAVKEMLLERTTVHPGALTPLGLWMSTNNGDYKKDDIIALLAEYSTGEDLEMINGEGDLPLHVAVRKQNATLTSRLLKLNPSLLYRENSTGRTPFEMARDTYTASLVSDPLTISTNNWDNYQPGRDEYYGITSKGVHEFAPKKEELEEQTAKRTWEICLKVDQEVAESKKKRRLVSLFEANEVARRVAGGKKRGVVVNGGLITTEVKRDVVSEWMNGW